MEWTTHKKGDVVENGNGKSKWHTGESMKCATGCSFVDTDKKPLIVIEYEVYAAIKKLCADIKMEWQMLLIGDETQGGIVIFDYYIPKQEVGYAHVKNLDCITPAFIQEKGIIAGIHSHADMNVFFSPTDEEFSNQSIIKNHIVINNKMEYKAVMRKDLPCGMVKFIDADVEFYFPPARDLTGLENIKKPEYKVTEYWNYTPKNDVVKANNERSVLDDESRYVPPDDADFPLEQDGIQGGYYNIDTDWGFKPGNSRNAKKKKNKFKKNNGFPFLKGGMA